MAALDLIAGSGDRTDTGNAGEQCVDRLRQLLTGDNWCPTGGDSVIELDWDVNVLDQVGALLDWDVIEVGVGQDADDPVAVLLDEFEGALLLGVGGVVDQVAVPDDVRCCQQQLTLGLGLVQAGVDLNWLAVDCLNTGFLEAAEQVCDRLVDAVNAGDGDWSRDDADCVGIITFIVCLPEGVQAPPACQVSVDGWNPWHWLVVLAVQADEPCGVTCGDLDLAGLWVGGQELLDSCRGIRDGIQVWEQGLDLTVVSVVEACLEAVHQVEETVIPGWVL